MAERGTGGGLEAWMQKGTAPEETVKSGLRRENVCIELKEGEQLLQEGVLKWIWKTKHSSS